MKVINKKLIEGQNSDYKVSFKIIKISGYKVIADIKLTNLKTNTIENISGNPEPEKIKLGKYSVKIPAVSITENFKNSNSLPLCPASHPYAFGTSKYGEGTGCCIGNPGKNPNGAFDCIDYGCGDGCGPFTTGCKGSTSCVNNNDVITNTATCPSTYPYPYNGGLYAGDGNKDHTYGYIESIKGTHNKKNYFCCKDAINQSQTTCANHVPCSQPPCYENKSNMISANELYKLTDTQSIKYVDLDNGVWKIFTAENMISGINLPPDNEDAISSFIDTSRQLQQVRSIGFSLKPISGAYSSQITEVEQVTGVDTKHSKLYKVHTVDNPGGINIKRNSNKDFPVDEFGLLYITPMDNDFSPCYSLDISVKKIIENNNCYSIPEMGEPIDSIQVDKKKLPQTKDNINIIKDQCILQYDGCFNSSNSNAKIPWCYKRGDLCKGNGKITDGYICEADPLIASWNNMQWVKGNPCTDQQGLIYKNTGGIFKCVDNHLVKALDMGIIQKRFSQYGRTQSSNGDFKVDDDISRVGGMKIYANRYIYAIIDHVVHRYDVLSSTNSNVWESLQTPGDYKMYFIALDNTKKFLYGIPYGTDQTKIMQYDILGKQWDLYNTSLPQLDGTVFIKILFTVDKNKMILLDSNSIIWHNNKPIYTPDGRDIIINDIILNNTGSHIFALITNNNSGQNTIAKIVLSTNIIPGSAISISKDTNQIMNSQFMNYNNIQQGTYQQGTYNNYNKWSCVQPSIKDSKGQPMTSCGPSVSWDSMGLGSVFELKNAITHCDKIDSCLGFYGDDNNSFFFSTEQGFPPKINEDKNNKGCNCDMSSVYIKQNIQNYSTKSLTLSYDGTKVYFITPEKQLKYYDLKTCKISESLLPHNSITSITLGPDRELYATLDSNLYKVNTFSLNNTTAVYTLDLIFKFKTAGSTIELCHNRPTIFIKYSNKYYYVNKDNKLLMPVSFEGKTTIPVNSGDKTQITKTLDINNTSCLYYAIHIKNNYMPISKINYMAHNLIIPDCTKYNGCNCFTSNETPYYIKQPGQPGKFSMNKVVDNVEYEIIRI